MRLTATVLVLACCVAAAWAIPALGGSMSPSNQRLAKRLNRAEGNLTRLRSDVATLSTRVNALAIPKPSPTVRVTRVPGEIWLGAPGVVPAWYGGRASCPLGTSVAGGGASFDGVYGNQAVLEQSYPNGNDWIVSLRYDPGAPVPPTIGIYAICVAASTG